MKEITTVQKDRVETVSSRRQPRKKVIVTCFLVSSQNPDVPTCWLRLQMSPQADLEPRCAHRLG